MRTRRIGSTQVADVLRIPGFAQNSVSNPTDTKVVVTHSLKLAANDSGTQAGSEFQGWRTQGHCQPGRRVATSDLEGLSQSIWPGFRLGLLAGRIPRKSSVWRYAARATASLCARFIRPANLSAFGVSPLASSCAAMSRQPNGGASGRNIPILTCSRSGRAGVGRFDLWSPRLCAEVFRLGNGRAMEGERSPPYCGAA
jgi:hypothetical protein